LRWIFILLVGVLLVSGCTQPQSSDTEPYTHDISTSTEDKAKLECIELCKRLSRLLELSDGPCLSDTEGGENWDIDDWVCDVAHSPRTAEDNLPENQCQDYREGRASHFVEISPLCEFIRAV
jgi:hypothetical protein